MKDELEEGEGQDLWPIPIDMSLCIGDPTNIDRLFSHQPSSNATRARFRAHARAHDADAAVQGYPPAFHLAVHGVLVGLVKW